MYGSMVKPQNSYLIQAYEIKATTIDDLPQQYVNLFRLCLVVCKYAVYIQWFYFENETINPKTLKTSKVSLLFVGLVRY